VAARLLCRVGRHRWEEKGSAPIGMPGSEKLVCRDCGVAGTRRKALRCHLGVHSWVLVVNEGERYEACRYCGKTGRGGAAPFIYHG
jgi:hypothetical protein